MPETNITITSAVVQPAPTKDTLPPLPKPRHKSRYGLFSVIATGLIISLMFGWKQFGWADARNTIFLALVGPMTGNDQENGKIMRQSTQLYVDQINRQGGIHGQPVKLLVYDDQNKPKLSKSIAVEIATKTPALLVIGHQSSSTSLAASPLYQQYGLPAITGSATADEVTQGNDWYFRTIFTASDQSALLANYINKILKYETAYLIFDQDAFGTALATAFVHATQKLGMTVKCQWSFKNSETNSVEESINQMVTTLQANPEPTVIFLAVHISEGAKIVIALKQLHHIQLVGPNSLAGNAFINELRKTPQERSQPGYYSDGIYIASPYLKDISGERARQFEEAYFSKYQEEPLSYEATYYDAVIMALHAIETTPASNPTLSLTERRAQVKQGLEQLTSPAKSVEGVTGNLYVDENRNVVRPIPIGIYKEGKPTVAMYQFQPLTNFKNMDNLLDEVLDNNIILMNGKFMHKAQVVYTGIDFNEISDFDLKNSTFTADFYLWFRFTDQLKDDHAIEFINVTDYNLGNPILVSADDGITTKTYRLKAKFKGNFDFHDYPLDRQILPIQFRHSQLTKEQLIYVVDTLGMQHAQKTGKEIAQQLDNKKVSTINGWQINQVHFFQDTKKNDSTLGVPKLFKTPQSIEYSRFNVAIQVERHLMSFMLKNLLAVFFLVVVGYLSMFIPISGLATRLGIGTTLFLTTSVFHLKLASELVNIDYPVLMEYFYYMLYLLSIFIMVTTTVAAYIYEEKKTADCLSMKRFNWFGQIVYPLAIIIFLGVIAYHYREILMG
jgi:branched-chain amino acid transport system substrate-binding protein